MSHRLFRWTGDRSKELPGKPGLPSTTLTESIDEHERDIECRHLVWLAALGELDPSAINLNENVPEGINNLSVTAISELAHWATRTYMQPENLGKTDVYRDFLALQFFV